jgi:hypothetical protein
MLTYPLGDVLRIFAGDFEVGEIDATEANQWVWVAASAAMLVPIAMVVPSGLIVHC